MRVFVGGALQPKLLALDDLALQTLVREELAELIGLYGDPLHAEVVRWNGAMPSTHFSFL